MALKVLILVGCIAMLLVGAVLGTSAAFLQWIANFLADSAERIMSNPMRQD